MSWVIDAILLAVIAFSVFQHFRHGLMYSVYKVAVFLLSLLSAAVFGRHLGAVLADGFVGNKISDYTYGKITQYVGDSKSLSQFFSDIPDGFKSFVKLMGGDVEALRESYGSIEGSEEILREMSETVSSPFANTVSSIIAYVLLFVCTFVVLSVVVFFLKKIKIPVLATVDKALGLVLGGLLGIFSAALISAALYSGIEFVAAMNDNSAVMDVYYDSKVFKFIYDLRIFDYIRNLL